MIWIIRLGTDASVPHDRGAPLSPDAPDPVDVFNTGKQAVFLSVRNDAGCEGWSNAWDQLQARGIRLIQVEKRTEEQRLRSP